MVSVGCLCYVEKDAAVLLEMLREKWKALPESEKKRYIEEEEKSSKRPELLGRAALFSPHRQQIAAKFALCVRYSSFTIRLLLPNHVFCIQVVAAIVYNVERGYKEHHQVIKDQYKKEEASILEMGRYVLQLDKSRYQRDLQTALTYISLLWINFSDSEMTERKKKIFFKLFDSNMIHLFIRQIVGNSSSPLGDFYVLFF